MKKLFFSLFVAGSVLSINAASVTASYTIPPLASTNLPTLLGGSLTLNSATIQATNVSSLNVYDWYTNVFFQTNQAYIQTTSIVTNYITIYTNYYGATNTWTNKVLLDYTNTVAAVTNALPVIFAWSAASNTTVQFQNLNARFQDGFSCTNTSANTFILTLQYTQ